MNVPQTIGKYQLEALLGEGGMGQVYKAFDPRVQRYLAIKILRQEDQGDPQREREFKERFFREGQICGRLNHPNIVTIYEMDEASGQLFIAMEYIQGQPLSKLINRDHGLPPQQQMEMLRQVAQALDYAHSLGVVHRDLKPSNIIWSDTGQAKMTDFGIAKLMADSESNLTRPGMFIGTPRYASPEQIRGNKVSAQSDIFSFGILAYVILTGSSPFPGSSISEILFKIASCKVSFQPIEETLRFSSHRLRDIFQRVFQHEPQARYQKAGNFFSALETALEKNPTDNLVLTNPTATVRLPMEHQPMPPDDSSDSPPTKTASFIKPPWAKQISEPEPANPWRSPDSLAKARSGPDKDDGDITDMPPKPNQTLRMPRAFLEQTESDAQPVQTPPQSVPIHQEKNLNPANPIQSNPPAIGNPSHASRYDDDEPSSPPWWLLGLLVFAAALGGLGWLAWPEIRTLWAAPEISQTARSNTPPDLGRQELGDHKDSAEVVTHDPSLDSEPTQPENGDDPIPIAPNLASAIEPSEDITDHLVADAVQTPVKPTPEPRKDPVKEREPTLPSPKPVTADLPTKTPDLTQPKSPPETLSDSRREASKPPPSAGKVVQPVVTKRIQPFFPDSGRDAGIEGEVILEAELRFDGKIGNISVLQTLGKGRYGFEDAAIKALLDYQFIPGHINHRPATMRRKFHFKFKLNARSRVSSERFSELVDETMHQRQPVGQTRKTPAIQHPVFHKKVPPVFPQAGLEAGLSGKVVLTAKLEKDGTISDIQVISGLGNGQYGFEQAAITAFKQWQFYPGKINGNPADMPIQVSLQFKLKKPE